MKTKKKILGTSTIALAGLLAVAGCSAQPSPRQPVPSVTMGTDHDMGSNEHNSADTMFAQMMIPHHEQAVLMGEIMLDKNNLSPELKALVTEIKDAQTPEIKLMEAWLEGWGEPRTTGHTMEMDGMLDAEALQSLTNAQGSLAEELFLEQMIEHHLGATKMAENALKNGKSPKSLELSGRIIDSQNAEIAHMRDMLKK